MAQRNKNPAWGNKEPLQRSMTFEKAGIDIEKRTVPLSFSSETTEVVRWGDIEILDHSPGACDLTQLNSIGVLLFNHNWDLPIGGIESAVIVNYRGEAVVRFDDDEESDKYFKKVISGTLKAVSCRYSVEPEDWEYVEANAMSSDGRFAGPCYVARKWKVIEISIVTIPADSSVGVGRSKELTVSCEKCGNIPCDCNSEEEMRSDFNMTPEQLAAIEAEKTRKAQEAADAIRSAAIEQERTRTTEITTMCRNFDVDPSTYITEGKTVDQVRSAILEKIQAERTARPNFSVGADEADKFRAAVTDGLAMRCGLTNEKPATGAENFRGMKLLDLARDCYERQTGKRAGYNDPMGLVRDAITGTSDFPNILANIANKSMSQAYNAAQTTFQTWTRKGSLSDFKTATRLRLSEADELKPLTELGEFKHAEVSEGKSTVQLGTYGRKWSLSRQAIINDDMSALSTLPNKYSMAAKRMINRMVYDILNNNAAITLDNVALFHANHGNLTGTGTAMSVISLGVAAALMRKQQNIGKKEYLNIDPEFLIVPVDLMVTGSQLIGSSVDPTKSNQTMNPFFNKLTLVSDAMLTNATGWYLAANPGLVDTIEVNYLNGVDTPVMESRVGFDVDGMEYRIRHDVGVSALDFRGFYKNVGV
ncbi:prohead protease/major capsid protein fusion protein [Pelosinus sp. UFO1]|uniref:prohead protease/major capsid protein fusion protein n=1 Tax=Pelosinus sp. UFO1 TaxID=484770 RepID=UPI0004D175EE|nr:prohead protease/major capsid protein fusion protein [Pelosinus sp. UFO1]AIF52008.1 peptidase U35 phage prohead HK97 [Pelosinus sp. UFO1]